MHECSEACPTTAAGEIAVAERALAAGDGKHAALHVANALAMSPNDRRLLALTDTLLDTPPSLWDRTRSLFGKRDPAHLFPEGSFAGNVAARARAHWRRGNLDDAFAMTVSIQVAIPHVDFQPWLEAIVDAAESSGRTLSPAPLLGAFGRLASRTVGVLHLRAGERALFAPWAELAARLASRSTDFGLAVAASGLLRRAGRHADALDVAERAANAHPTESMVWTQVGLALRGCGRFDEAVAAFERGLSGEPRTRDCEIARVRYDQGAFTEALAAFERHAGGEAEVSLAAELTQRALGRAVEQPTIARVFPDGAVTYDHLRRALIGDGTGLGMMEASTNAIRQMLEQNPGAARPMDVQLTTTRLEPPSALLALALIATPDGDPARLSYTAEATPSHHPAQPLATGGLELWRLDGSIPTPAVERPSPALLALVETLALDAPAMSVLVARAKSAEMQSALRDVDPAELAAAFVHPPPLPPEAFPDAHVIAWQRAVALLLAHQRESEPWLRSMRRDSLQRILTGPPDYTLAMGLVALTEVLLDTPEALDDARRWLDVVRRAGVDGDGGCLAGAVGHLTASVPAFAPEVRGAFAAWLDQPSPS